MRLDPIAHVFNKIVHGAEGGKVLFKCLYNTISLPQGSIPTSGLMLASSI